MLRWEVIPPNPPRTDELHSGHQGDGERGGAAAASFPRHDRVGRGCSEATQLGGSHAQQLAGVCGGREHRCNGEHLGGPRAGEVSDKPTDFPSPKQCPLCIVWCASECGGR